MGSFEAKDSKFIYAEGNSTKVLLDLNDFLSNFGRIPFHSDITDVTIPNLIMKNMDNHNSYCEGKDNQEKLLVYYTMLDVLFVREHVKSKFPKKIAVVTRESDVLTKHLSFMAGYLHPETEIKQVTAEMLRQTQAKSLDMVFVDATESDIDMHIFEMANDALKRGGAIVIVAISQGRYGEIIDSLFNREERYFVDDQAEILSAYKSEYDMNELPRGSCTNKIDFIMCTNNMIYAKECKRYIDALEVPNDMEIDVLEVTEAKSMTAGYNEGMAFSDARYKVYIHQDVFITNKRFVFDVLKCFESDEKLGLLGIAGARKVPDDAYVCTALDIGGCCSVGAFTGYGSIAVKPEIYNPSGLFEETEYIDGMLMVTSYDLPWDERMTGFHFYDLSQCINYRKHGLKIGVARQEEIWTFHDFGPLDLETYDVNRRNFCTLYNGFNAGEDSDSDNIYKLCKTVNVQLQGLYDKKQYDVIEQTLDDLQTAIYFHQDLLTMTFALEIKKLEGDVKYAKEVGFKEYKDNYLRLRLLLNGISYSMNSMDELVSKMISGEISAECAIVTILHNVIAPDEFLKQLAKALEQQDYCTESNFINKCIAIKQFETQNLAMP